MKPLDVAEVLERTAADMNNVAHDIRQRLNPGYSNVNPEELTPVEQARIKAAGELVSPVMGLVWDGPQKPQTQEQPQTGQTPPAPTGTAVGGKS